MNIIDVKSRCIIKNDGVYYIPKKIKCKNITQINEDIFIDGYEFKNKKFKRTLKAFFHLFF